MRRRDFLRSALAAGAAIPAGGLLGECHGSAPAGLLQSSRGRLTGLPTGFYELDDLRDGLQPGEFVLIAARRAGDASALACNIALNAATIWRRPVVYLAPYRHPTEVAAELVASNARLSARRVTDGRLSREELRRAVVVAREIAEAPLVIEGAESLECLQARLRQEREAGLVVVEDLHRLGALHEGNHGSECGAPRALREIARRMNVPLIAAAGVSREERPRAGQRIRLEDLEPAAAEAADCVLALHRDGRDAREEWRQSRSVCEVRILKHRRGLTGRVRLMFIKDCARFENWAPL